VWISIGALPLLRLGDVWRTTALGFQPDYELETFEILQIDRDHNCLIKTGLNINNNNNNKGYLLPISGTPPKSIAVGLRDHFICERLDISVPTEAFLG
jgi:hypothetical protein